VEISKAATAGKKFAHTDVCFLAPKADFKGFFPNAALTHTMACR
jgi:hypothetical protein